MHQVCGITGMQSFAEARNSFNIDLLETRQKTVRASLIMKILLSDEKHNALIQSFGKLQSFSCSTRSVSNRAPVALAYSTSFYYRRLGLFSN